MNTIDIPVDPSEKEPVKIVGNAGIASEAQGEGRIIPVLILDTSNRPDIDELVKFQQFSPSGDVRSSWGWVEPKWWQKYLSNPETISLVLQFERPSEVNIILNFDISKDGILIDAIVNSQAVFLQPGRKGDRVIDDPNKSKIMAEIPRGGIVNAWNQWWENAVAKQLRKNGLSRSEATKAAAEMIEQTRQISNFRMRG